MTQLRRAFAALTALAACTTPTPGTDSAQAVDTAAAAAVTPSPAAAPDSASAPADTAPATPSTPGQPPAQPRVGPRVGPRSVPRAERPAPDTAVNDLLPGRPRLTPRPPRPVPRPMPASPTLNEPDQATIDQLRAETKALARVDGCATSGECAALGIGERACGGPEEFVVYCPKTTDVAALRRKAAQLAAAQKAFNEKNGVMSTCELRTPPQVVLAGGACRAATGGAPSAPKVP